MVPPRARALDGDLIESPRDQPAHDLDAALFEKEGGVHDAFPAHRSGPNSWPAGSSHATVEPSMTAHQKGEGVTFVREIGVLSQRYR
jgi:hypothetical protein